MASITVPTRPARQRWMWIGLGVLTIVSFLPASPPQGPFDARDGARIPGVHLEMPLTAVLLEPLAAPVYVLAGAPDFRRAGVATLVWVALGAAGWWLVRHRGTKGRRRILGAAGAGVAAAGLLAAWLGFGVAVRLPGWRLVCDDPAWVVADLHTHTYGSHDGLVSADANLGALAASGYDLVAVTEHKRPAGAFAAVRAARSHAPAKPAVIPGVEVRSPLGPYLLGIGLRPGIELPRRNGRGDPSFEARFVRAVHRDHEGAVIALSYRLSPSDIDRLIDLGVDAFEISNSGHPALEPAVRRALLAASREQGIPLIASSDWHGWGGIFRTWTLVRRPPFGTSQAGDVLWLLRHRRRKAFVPVIAGTFVQPGWFRIVTAPFFETVRYLSELSPLRVLVWWVWTGALSFLWAGLRRRGVPRPGRFLLAPSLWILSAGLGYRGFQWVAVWASGATVSSFPAEIGFETVGLALACAAAGAVSAHRELRALRGTRAARGATQAACPATDLLPRVAEDAGASG
ncbi:PHP domain-containing protein [Deferrisoma camini]|uniref:PHP domain-containing protein n=1 Tax=Deferrisoma camini TaxID=1035120 RepID=UPI00046C97D5|nr:PHP domain-containing protein [Deferrisoma camini]